MIYYIMTKKSEYVGTCQVCFNKQKIRNDRLVLHGYTRPGDGFLHGDCSGSNEFPYEEDCQLTKRILEMVESHLTELEKHLTKLKNHEIKDLDYGYVIGIKYVLVKGYNGNFKRPVEETKIVKVHIGDPEKSAPPDVLHTYAYLGIPSYESLLQREIFDYEKRIQMTKRDVAFFKDKVNSWKATPLTPVETAAAKKFVIQYKNLVPEFIPNPKYSWDKIFLSKVGVWQDYRTTTEDKVEKYKQILVRKKKRLINSGVVDIRVIQATS